VGARESEAPGACATAARESCSRAEERQCVVRAYQVKRLVCHTVGLKVHVYRTPSFRSKQGSWERAVKKDHIRGVEACTMHDVRCPWVAPTAPPPRKLIAKLRRPRPQGRRAPCQACEAIGSGSGDGQTDNALTKSCSTYHVCMNDSLANRET
jgi:hypothetical protein